MTAVESDHTWFAEHLPAAIAGGLSISDRQRFHAHTKTCDACAALLNDAISADNAFREMFEDARPPVGFEDRIVTRLREERGPRFVIPPFVRTVATGLAAAMVLGSLGLIWTFLTADRPRITSASNVRASALAGFAIDGGRSATQPNSHDGDGQNVGYTDAHVEWFTHPFTGVQRNTARDNIVSSDERGRPISGPVDSNDSVLLPSDDQIVDGLVNVNSSSTDVLRKLDINVPGAGGTKDTFGGATETGKVRATTGGKENQEASNGSNLYYRYRNNAPSQSSTSSFKPDQAAKGSGVTVPDGGTLLLGGQVLGIADAGGKNPQQSGNSSTHDQPTKLAVDGTASVMGDVSGVSGQPTTAPSSPPVSSPAALGRKIIREGQMEFEVDSFDSAFATISKIVSEDGGFVAAADSTKLPNGKVRGTVTVRVPPDRLDGFVLKLRALGDLKGQRLGSTDVSKQYTDIESELKAARGMEERLLEIIKTAKGAIKDLLAAEKELAEWRTKIEKLEGEIRYYNNLIAMATLAITLAEKDIKTPAAAVETEAVNAGVECGDVEKARGDLLKSIVEEFKGWVIKSDLKKLEAGQFAATIVAGVPRETSGLLIDRLRQISGGKIARLDVERHLNTEGGADATPSPNLRVEKRESLFNISLYNLANVAPRQTTSLNLAAENVELTYRTILTLIAATDGSRVVSSNLDRPKPDETTGMINFETPADKADALLAGVRDAGEVMRLAVTENPDTANVTTTKRGFVVQIASIATVAPRETTIMRLAARDVAGAYNTILAAARDNSCRILASQLSEQDRQNVTGMLDLEVKRPDLAAIEKTMSSIAAPNAVDVISRNTSRSIDTQNTIDTKIRLQLSLLPADRVPPRQLLTAGVEVSDVEKIAADLQAQASAASGRTIESRLTKEASGRISSRVVLDIPLGRAAEFEAKVRNVGTVKSIESSRNTQVPDGPLATARFDVTVASSDRLVDADSGLIYTIREGFGTSLRGLLWSLRLIVIGLCLAVPWAMLFWLGWRVVRARRAVVTAGGAGKAAR